MLRQQPQLAPTSDLCSGVVEPLPFHPKNTQLHDIHDDHAGDDPFFQSILEMLLTMDDDVSDRAAPLEKASVVASAAWPQLTTIKIPSENAFHLITTAHANGGFVTPDDQRVLPTLAHVISPSGGVHASRKRLRVETLTGKAMGMADDDEEGQHQKRLLTNIRRDAVMELRDEARALETTLNSLHLRQTRPKPAVSDDPDALIKSYTENIQLKRAIEEQDVRIKTLRRAVSVREGKNIPLALLQDMQIERTTALK